MKPSEKTKILFFLPTLGAGGAERILITLMNNIDRNRFEPIFLALNESGPVKEWMADDIPFYSFGHSSVKASVLKLIQFIRTHKPDVIFTTMVHSNALACLMKIFFPNIKVVIRESSIPSALVTKYGVKGKICKIIYRVLYPFANNVICPGQIIIKDFENLHINTQNFTVIYNPVDTNKIKPETHQINDSRNSINFICLGRLAREKGLTALIEALPEPSPDFSWHLDLIGDGEERNKLEQLTKIRNLQNHITFHGYVQNPWEQASHADCLLLPSLWEGMPNVTLEALHCGLNVIALKSAGAIEEIASHSNHKVSVVSTIKEMILEMKTLQPQTSKKSYLPKAFTLEDIMKRYEEVFTK